MPTQPKPKKYGLALVQAKDLKPHDVFYAVGEPAYRFTVVNLNGCEVKHYSVPTGSDQQVVAIDEDDRLHCFHPDNHVNKEVPA